MSLTYANGAPREGAGRQEIQSGRIGTATNSDFRNALQAPLCAELIGSHTCSASGITAKGHAPVLALCRELLAQGLDPDAALTVYRNGAEALRIRSIREAAKLAVRDDDRGVPRFRRWEPSEAVRKPRPCVQTVGLLNDRPATSRPSQPTVAVHPQTIQTRTGIRRRMPSADQHTAVNRKGNHHE